MSSINLSSIIDADYIDRISSISQVGTGSTASEIVAALKDGGSSKTSVSSTLRSGARIYANGLQRLNSVISVLNLAESALGKISEITDRAIELADDATESRHGFQTRKRLNAQFEDIAKEFREAIENAQIESVEYLDINGLTEVFTIAGLDPEKLSEVKGVIEGFLLPGDPGLKGDADTVMASEKVQGARPVHLPTGAGHLKGEVSDIFDEPDGLLSRASATRVLTDLKALKTQITANIEATQHARTFVGENIDLVRATGLAMLDISDSLKGDEEADLVARQLRQAIRKNAGQALSHAESLDPIAVAALVGVTDSE